LKYASAGGYTEIAEMLIDNGADVNAKEVWAALTIASGLGYTEIAEMLIDNGANVNKKTNFIDGISLNYSVFDGYIETEGIQIVYGYTNEDWTALMYAAAGGYTEIVEMLIDNGTVVNLKADNGSTASMIAIEKGYTEIVNILKEAGAQE